MSSTTSSHDGTSKSTTLATTKDKMKVQQRMIDLTARELQSTRLSSQAIAESSPGNALEENILLVEVYYFIPALYMMFYLLLIFRIN